MVVMIVMVSSRFGTAYIGSLVGVAHGSRIVRVVAVARVIYSTGEPLLSGLVTSTVVRDNTVGGAGQDRVHLDNRIRAVLVERERGLCLFLLPDD